MPPRVIPRSARRSLLAAIAVAAAALPALTTRVPAQTPPAGPPATQPVEPVLPPGVSEYDIEVWGTYAYTWRQPDGTDVVELLGGAELRMGGYRLRARDAVIWFSRAPYRDRPYYTLEVFLWHEASVRYPGGTIETSDAQIVSLRSFGNFVLNADGHAAQKDESSEVFRAAAALRAGQEPPSQAALEKSETPLTAEPVGVSVASRPATPPRQVMYRSNDLSSRVRDGRRIVVAIGDVYVAQGAPESGDFLEIRADNAVLYMHEEKLQESTGGKDKPEEQIPTSPADETLKGQRDERQTAREYVEAVYLEGDVVLTRGMRMIRATKIYYDFDTERALILDAIMRVMDSMNKVPIYVRADQVRQLSGSEYRTGRTNISTSEFHTPHVSLRATETTVIDRTPRDASGEITGVVAGTYEAKHTTLNVGELPILYWPVARGDFQQEQMPLRSVRTGYNSEYGAIFESSWRMFNLLGMQPPPGYDATLHMDYFSQRGPATGIDLDYTRDDYLGLFRSYYVHDDDEDDIGGVPNRGGKPDTENRGRVLWRHRQFLEKGWELTLETSYISDDQFMEAWERNEFENGKDQESVINLIKRQDNWQFSSLVNARLNDFVTLTEHYPDVRFSWIGEPLADFATFYHDSRVSIARYSADDDLADWQLPRYERSSGAINRGDTREELTYRLPALGPIRLTPYTAVRGTAWDDAVDSGGLTRAFGSAGVKGNMYLQRVYDEVESRLLDLHRMRHILKPEFAVWGAASNVDSREQYPLDPDVERIDDFGGAMIGLRQRWQTQRGEAGRWRTVDWIVLDLKSVFFDNPRPGDNTHGNYIGPRPEDSISSNALLANMLWRISDTTALVYDGVYDWNRGNVGSSNVSLAYERLPRLATFIGWRYIHDTDNNLLAFGGNYKLNEKYTVGLREYYDIEQNRNLETQLILVRRWPRWYSALSVEWDRTIDDVSVTIAIWPEGASGVAIGSKRYTPLGEGVGIRP